jgi:DNA modification methylase
VKNQLFYGDNLEVLRKYIKDETVDLCYIDPPFNSKRNYNQIYNNIGTEDRAQAQAFVDTWEWDDMAITGFEEILSNATGGYTSQTVDLIKGLSVVLKKGSLLAYLVSMTQRVTEIYRVLKPTGSFYLHCDPTASHYLKLMLDAVFVANGGDYRNEISWKRTDSHNDAKRFGKIHDVIFYYVKNVKSAIFKPVYSNYTANYITKEFKQDSEGRLYKCEDLTAPSHGSVTSGKYDFHGRTPGASRMWRMKQEAMEDLWEQGRIKTDENGIPLLRGQIVYLDEKKGMPAQDFWEDVNRIGNTSGERLGYPTQKPEALLDRIISASTNEGDVVLDAYCGCGTTVAVAERLKREWIGIDITYQSISLILRRLEAQYGKEVLDNVTLNGIPKDMKSAEALALKKDDRTRKEFEKWAVLTHSNNRAIINDKKGGDGGIDGTAFFMTGPDDNAKIVFQVKSGNVGRGDIAKLNSDRQRENAELAIFITLKEPTKGMIEEANGIGDYTHPLVDKKYRRVQIVTIKEMIEDEKRLEIAMSREVVKRAKVVVEDTQQDLFADE